MDSIGSFESRNMVFDLKWLESIHLMTGKFSILTTSHLHGINFVTFMCVYCVTLIASVIKQCFLKPAYRNNKNKVYSKDSWSNFFVVSCYIGHSRLKYTLDKSTGICMITCKSFLATEVKLRWRAIVVGSGVYRQCWHLCSRCCSCCCCCGGGGGGGGSGGGSGGCRLQGGLDINIWQRHLCQLAFD